MTVDKHSATWLAIKAHVDKEIEAARNRLEIAGTSPDMERGAIKALRGILALTVKTERELEIGSSDSGY